MPVNNLQVFSGWLEWGQFGDDLEAVPIQINETGGFEFTAGLAHSVLWEEIAGERVPKGEVWVPKYYLFRAPGCEDRIITVDETWESREILLDCVVQ